MQTTDRGPLHVVHSKPAASAAEIQRAPIESLMLSLGKLGVRVLAVVAPTGAQEVRPLSRALCASFAAADNKTVLIDLDPADATDESDPGWNPGLKLTTMHTQRDPAGYDLVVSRPTAQTRPLFNNLAHFRRALTEDLGRCRDRGLRHWPNRCLGCHQGGHRPVGCGMQSYRHNSRQQRSRSSGAASGRQGGKAQFSAPPAEGWSHHHSADEQVAQFLEQHPIIRDRRGRSNDRINLL